MDHSWSDINLGESRKERRGGSYRDRRIVKGADYRDSQGRLVNTREYALAWGVRERPYSAKELIAKCRAEDAPSYQFLTKKCWNGYPRYYDALVRAGMEPRPPRNDMERRKELARISRDGFHTALLEQDYDVARMAAEYGILTEKDYNRVRRERPDAREFLPCMRTIERRFGSWKRFKYEIMKYNADLVMGEYVRGSHERGHWLRLRECDQLGIPIRGIMDLLRPTLFNVLCYRKLDAMGLERFDSDMRSGGRP